MLALKAVMPLLYLSFSDGSQWGVTVPCPGQQRYLETVLLRLSQLAKHSWHLVGRGQDCCPTTYSAQDAPPQRMISPKTATGLRLRNPGQENRITVVAPCVGNIEVCAITVS